MEFYLDKIHNKQKAVVNVCFLYIKKHVQKILHHYLKKKIN